MSDFYDSAPPPDHSRLFGPVFEATYEGDCASCPDPILEGEDIRADGRGGWIHADDMCERVAIAVSNTSPQPTPCDVCWTYHGPGQQECK